MLFTLDFGIEPGLSNRCNMLRTKPGVSCGLDIPLGKAFAGNSVCIEFSAAGRCTRDNFQAARIQPGKPRQFCEIGRA